MELSLFMCKIEKPTFFFTFQIELDILFCTSNILINVLCLISASRDNIVLTQCADILSVTTGERVTIPVKTVPYIHTATNKSETYFKALHHV